MKRISLGVYFLGIIFLFFVSGCQTTQTTQSNISNPISTLDDNGPVEDRKYGLFFDQGDHLDELIDQGLYRTAGRLYNKYHDSYFSKENNQGKHSKELDLVASKINEIYYPELTSLIEQIRSYNTWPLPQDSWADFESLLIKTNETLANYNTYLLLQNENRRSPYVATTAKLINDVFNKLENFSNESFNDCDLYSDVSFFDVYPLTITEKSTFLLTNKKQIEDKLAEADSFQIELFFETYISDQDEELNELVSNIYFEKHLDSLSESNNIDLEVIVESINNLREKGFNPTSIKNQNVVFIEATNQTLLTEGLMEFPVEADVDLPFEYMISELNEPLSESSASKHVIIFDVAQAEVKRRIQKREQVDSEYLAGYKDVYNPEFKTVSVALREAERALNGAQNTYCYGQGWASIICNAAKIIAITSSRNKLTAANQVYINTPEIIQEEIHKKYRFSVSDIDVTKTATVNYYLVDRVNNNYFKSSFDVSENESFKIAYNLKDEDLQKYTHLATYENEDKIENFEDASIIFKSSNLLNHFAENKDKVKKLDSEVAISKELLHDKNIALLNYKKNTYETKALNDKRFNSTVVIYNPEGSLGTGFYVAPNLVLTNYHVIEGTKFIEMKMHNGIETFGKVVKSDVRLDLALIKTESRGEPVEFYDLKEMNLGTEIEAVGHPQGLEFSITRGVVSALRKKQSVYDLGGKEILFIQTDAAINPGNSGGPLYMGNKVIGVNNQKLVAAEVEGLGFAIHFSEVQNFLSKDF